MTEGLLHMEARVGHSSPFKEDYDLCYIMSTEFNTACPLLPGNMYKVVTSYNMYVTTFTIGEVHYEYKTKIPSLVPPVR